MQRRDFLTAEATPEQGLLLLRCLCRLALSGEGPRERLRRRQQVALHVDGSAAVETAERHQPVEGDVASRRDADATLALRRVGGGCLAGQELPAGSRVSELRRTTARARPASHLVLLHENLHEVVELLQLDLQKTLAAFAVQELHQRGVRAAGQRQGCRRGRRFVLGGLHSPAPQKKRQPNETRASPVPSEAGQEARRSQPPGGQDSPPRPALGALAQKRRLATRPLQRLQRKSKCRASTSKPFTDGIFPGNGAQGAAGKADRPITRR